MLVQYLVHTSLQVSCCSERRPGQMLSQLLGFWGPRRIGRFKKVAGGRCYRKITPRFEWFANVCDTFHHRSPKNTTLRRLRRSIDIHWYCCSGGQENGKDGNLAQITVKIPVCRYFSCHTISHACTHADRRTDIRTSINTYMGWRSQRAYSEPTFRI